MKIRVLCYEGYMANEVPRALVLGTRRIEVADVLDRWRGEDHEYVKVSGADGSIYVVRYSTEHDQWDLVLMDARNRGRAVP